MGEGGAGHIFTHGYLSTTITLQESTLHNYDYKSQRYQISFEASLNIFTCKSLCCMVFLKNGLTTKVPPPPPQTQKSASL